MKTHKFLTSLFIFLYWVSVGIVMDRSVLFFFKTINPLFLLLAFVIPLVSALNHSTIRQVAVFLTDLFVTDQEEERRKRERWEEVIKSMNDLMIIEKNHKTIIDNKMTEVKKMMEEGEFLDENRKSRLTKLHSALNNVNEKMCANIEFHEKQLALIKAILQKPTMPTTMDFEASLPIIKTNF